MSIPAATLEIQRAFLRDLLSTLQGEHFDSPGEIMLVLHGQEAHLNQQIKARKSS